MLAGVVCARTHAHTHDVSQQPATDSYALCSGDDDGELEIGGEGMPLEITGELGACVRGTLVLERGGGTIQGLRVESATGSCVWLSAGTWSLSSCVLVAQRCYSTALLCSGDQERKLETPYLISRMSTEYKLCGIWYVYRYPYLVQ